MSNDDADPRVQLVDIADQGDAHVVFRKPGSVGERGLALVAAARDDFREPV